MNEPFVLAGFFCGACKKICPMPPAGKESDGPHWKYYICKDCMKKDEGEDG